MKRTIMMFLAGTFVLGSAAFAQDRPHMRREMFFAHRDTLKMLTAELREEIRDLRQEWNKERVQIEADREIAGIELQQLLQGESFSESKVRSQLEKIASYGVELKLGKLKLRNTIKGMMTPEQWKRFQQRGKGRMYGQHGSGTEDKKEKHKRPGFRGKRRFRGR